MRRHALLRQQRLDYIGQGNAALVQGAHGAIALARSQMQEGVPVDGEMPVSTPISTLRERGMNDDELRRGIARLLGDEEADQSALPAVPHVRADGQIEVLDGVPVTLRPGEFRVAHMGGRQWLLQGGTALFSRYSFNEEENAMRIDADATQTVADEVLTLAQGWIVAELHGRMWSRDNDGESGEAGYVEISRLLIKTRDRLQTDWQVTVGEDDIGRESMSFGDMPVAYVVAPGVQGNARPLIFDDFCTGDFRLLVPRFYLWHGYGEGSLP